MAETGAEPGRYSFDHALIRETLYEGMSRPRRARIHRHVGEALEADGGEPETGRWRCTSRARPGPRMPTRRSPMPRRRASVRPRCSPTRRRPSTTGARWRCSTGSAARMTGAAGDLLLLQGEAQVRAGEPERAWHAFSAAAALGGATGRQRDRDPRRRRCLAPLHAAARRGRHRTHRFARARAGAHPGPADGHARPAPGPAVRSPVLLAGSRADGRSRRGGGADRRATGRPRSRDLRLRGAPAGALGPGSPRGAACAPRHGC